MITTSDALKQIKESFSQRSPGFDFPAALYKSEASGASTDTWSGILGYLDEWTQLSQESPESEQWRMVYEQAEMHSAGLARTWFDNGQLKSLGRIQRGQRLGQWIWYYPSGTVELKSQYVSNLLDGQQIAYFPNGRIKQTTLYQQNKAIGNSTLYGENGQIEDVIDHSKVKVVSDVPKEKTAQTKQTDVPAAATEIFPKEEKAEIIPQFVDRIDDLTLDWWDDANRLEGLKHEDKSLQPDFVERTYFYASGKIMRRGFYLETKPFGEHLGFYPEGEKAVLADYSEGSEKLFFQVFHRNGRLYYSGKYSGSIKIGEHLKFEDTGVNLEKATYDVKGKQISFQSFEPPKATTSASTNSKSSDYSNQSTDTNQPFNLPMEIVKTYFPDRTVSTSSEVIGGVRVGKHTEYYPNGKVKLRAEYSKGKPFGYWEYYKENGDLIEVKQMHSPNSDQSYYANSQQRYKDSSLDISPKTILIVLLFILKFAFLLRHCN